MSLYNCLTILFTVSKLSLMSSNLNIGAICILLYALLYEKSLVAAAYGEPSSYDYLYCNADDLPPSENFMWHPSDAYGDEYQSSNLDYSLDPSYNYAENSDLNVDLGEMFTDWDIQDEPSLDTSTEEQYQTHEINQKDTDTFPSVYSRQQFMYAKSKMPEGSVRCLDDWNRLVAAENTEAMQVLTAFKAAHARRGRVYYQRKKAREAGTSQQVDASLFEVRPQMMDGRVDEESWKQIRRALTYLRQELKSYKDGKGKRRAYDISNKRNKQKRKESISAAGEEIYDLIVQIRRIFNEDPSHPSLQPAVDKLNNWMSINRHHYKPIKIPNTKALIDGWDYE